jgi:hypothetical protein
MLERSTVIETLHLTWSIEEDEYWSLCCVNCLDLVDYFFVVVLGLGDYLWFDLSSSFYAVD